MEGTTTINEARELFGKNFLGPLELEPMFKQMGLNVGFEKIPAIHYTKAELENAREELGLKGVKPTWLEELEAKLKEEAKEENTKGVGLSDGDLAMIKDMRKKIYELEKLLTTGNG